MKSDIAMYFADLTVDWSHERRYHLMCARVKRLCTNNYGYPPVPVTDEEKAADASWDHPFVGRDLGLGPFRSPGKPSVEIRWVSGKNAALPARLCMEFVEAVPGMWERSGLATETAPS